MLSEMMIDPARSVSQIIFGETSLENKNHAMFQGIADNATWRAMLDAATNRTFEFPKARWSRLLDEVD